MKTTKTSLNCDKCGKFYSKDNLLPLCTSCMSKLCENCCKPHNIPEHLLDSVEHFCSKDCIEEFDAIGDVEEAGIKLITEVVKLHETTNRIYGKANPIYNGSDNPISYVSDPKTKAPCYFLDFGLGVKVVVNLTLL